MHLLPLTCVLFQPWTFASGGWMWPTPHQWILWWFLAFPFWEVSVSVGMVRVRLPGVIAAGPMLLLRIRPLSRHHIPDIRRWIWAFCWFQWFSARGVLSYQLCHDHDSQVEVTCSCTSTDDNTVTWRKSPCLVHLLLKSNNVTVWNKWHSLTDGNTTQWYNNYNTIQYTSIQLIRHKRCTNVSKVLCW